MTSSTLYSMPSTTSTNRRRAPHVTPESAVGTCILCQGDRHVFPDRLGTDILSNRERLASDHLSSTFSQASTLRPEDSVSNVSVRRSTISSRHTQSQRQPSFDHRSRPLSSPIADRGYDVEDRAPEDYAHFHNDYTAPSGYTPSQIGRPDDFAPSIASRPQGRGGSLSGSHRPGSSLIHDRERGVHAPSQASRVSSNRYQSPQLSSDGFSRGPFQTGTRAVSDYAVEDHSPDEYASRATSRGSRQISGAPSALYRVDRRFAFR